MRAGPFLGRVLHSNYTALIKHKLWRGGEGWGGAQVQRPGAIMAAGGGGGGGPAVQTRAVRESN